MVKGHYVDLNFAKDKVEGLHVHSPEENLLKSQISRLFLDAEESGHPTTVFAMPV